MASSSKPFSAQLGTELEELIVALPQHTVPSVRIFARCCLQYGSTSLFANPDITQKQFMSMFTYPDQTSAAVLDYGILAVSQSARSTGCDIEIAALNNRTYLRLYFHPARDTLDIWNLSSVAAVTLHSTGQVSTTLPPKAGGSLEPGPWTIRSLPPQNESSPVNLVDLFVQPRYLSASLVDAGPPEGVGSKRHHQAAVSTKRQKTAIGSRSVLSTPVTNPLLQLSDGQIVRMTGQHHDDTYQLTRQKHLKTTPAATLYKAQYSRRPDQEILTKVLKPGENAYATAEAWRREETLHKVVSVHPSIAKLFGSDARYHAFYIELIDAPPLDNLIDESGKCHCPQAAFTILSDLASALQFMHTKGFLHNDIKPANIIYHHTRGAVLIDFGLGGKAGTICDGGTPWYLPPEYLASHERGPKSDVFALGVTLLWVLRKCPLPERSDVWQIRDIHQRKDKHNREPARRAQRAMRSWLWQVETYRLALSQSEGSLEAVVRRMLRTDTRERPRNTAEVVVKELEMVAL